MNKSLANEAKTPLFASEDFVLKVKIFINEVAEENTEIRVKSIQEYYNS